MASFKKNVLTLISGAVLFQAIPILLMPIMTRIFVPQDFSVLASFAAVVSVLGAIISGKLEMAIMKSLTLAEVSATAMLSIAVTAATSFFIAIVCFLFAKPFSVLLGQEAIEPWLKWIFIPLFAIGLSQILVVVLNWEKKYVGISAGRVAQNLMNALTAIGLGFLKILNGLVLGYVVGLVVSVGVYLSKSQFKLSLFRFSNFKALLKQHLNYPLYLAPASLLDAASSSACIFILGKFYSKQILGQFSLTHRLLLIPMALIGTSVAQAFFQHASSACKNNEKLYPVLLSVSKKLLFYSFPAFVALLVLAPALFSLFFGPNWREAGEYTRIIAMAYWIRFAVSPVSTIFIVVDKLKLGTLWQVSYFITSFSVLGLCAYLQVPISQFLIIYCVHDVVLYGAYFLMARHACLTHQLISERLCVV